MELVAHRGWPARYPENTLPGLEAALDAGARFVEFDVQLGADGAPVLLHDASLGRTAGVDRSVFDLTGDELAAIEVNESARLGGRFRGVRVPGLADALRLVHARAGVRAFVEIKIESLARFGTARVLDRLVPVLEGSGERVIAISYDAGVLEGVRDRSPHPIGWILPAWSKPEHARADALAPEFLFCDRHRLPAGPEPLRPGPWRWAIYTVDEPEEARRLVSRGAALVETDDIGGMKRRLKAES